MAASRSWRRGTRTRLLTRPGAGDRALGRDLRFDLHLLTWGLPVDDGPRVRGLLDDGTAVAVQPNAPCGKCAVCVAGREHLCPASNDRIHGVFSDGGLADEVIVDRSCLVLLAPESGRRASARSIEPISVALHTAPSGRAARRRADLTACS